MEGFAAGIAVRPLGDRDHRYVGKAEFREGLAGGIELPGAAVDQDEVGPGDGVVVSRSARFERIGSRLTGIGRFARIDRRRVSWRRLALRLIGR